MLANSGVNLSDVTKNIPSDEYPSYWNGTADVYTFEENTGPFAAPTEHTYSFIDALYGAYRRNLIPEPLDHEKVLFSAATIDPLFPLVVSGDRLSLAIPAQDEADLKQLEAFKPEMLRLAEKRIEAYQKSPNRPQATHFRPDLELYRTELAKDPSDISFVILWSRGRQLSADYEAALEEVAAKDTEWPDFEPKEKAELTSLIDLHGQLMMSSREGRDLVARALQYQSTPQEDREASELIDALRS